MYLDLMARDNPEFVNSITRSNPRFRTKRLDAVVAALEAAQRNISPQILRNLLDALHAWRMGEPREFNNRGGTNGVAYRLWMEAKQMLANLFLGQHVGHPDPPVPPGCPGDTLLNVYVPPAEGQSEICHGFAYRWRIASGRLDADPTVSPRKNVFSFNGPNMAPVLYPGGPGAYRPARVGGAMALQPGDLVGMFIPSPRPGGPPLLGHSLIAETPTTWFSANNAGTFGVGTGRTRIDTTLPFGTFAGHQVGWVGATNQWRRPDGIVADVIYVR